MKTELCYLLMFLIGNLVFGIQFSDEEVKVFQEMCRLKFLDDTRSQKNCTEAPPKIEESQIEEAEANATLVCRDVDFIILGHNPGVFVIERRPVGDTNWSGAVVIREPPTYMRRLVPGKPYEYRIRRILASGFSKPEIIGPFESFTPIFRNIRKIQNVSISEFEVEADDPHHLKVDVSFSPSEVIEMTTNFSFLLNSETNVKHVAIDQSCLYEATLWDHNNRNTLIDLNATIELRTTFGDLEFERDYSVDVRSFTTSGISSPKTQKPFATPTCRDFHKNLILCKPARVTGLNATMIRRGENIFDVTVTWNTPNLLPDYYEVHMGEIDAPATEIRNVSGNQTEVIFPVVEIVRMADVSIKAISPGGTSEPIYKRLKAPEPPSTLLRIIIIVGAVTGMLILITGTGFCACYVHGRRKLNRIRRKYFDPSSEKDVVLLGPEKQVESVTPEPIIVVTTPILPAADEYEINRDRLEIDKILGTGAFGVVRLGSLRDDRGLVTPVAIKMLRESPDAEAVQSFEHEIKLMKSTGIHPNIVSLIGCCTRSTPRLLIVEYCSRGDLETFLKNASIFTREQVVQMTKQSSVLRRFHGYQNVEDNFRETVSVSMNAQKDLHVNNFIANCAYGFDRDTFHNTEIVTIENLLNFGRQIATGMEFLASIKVLHRDLAARNVLLCNDWTVKISDFGLSRDIYQDNVYKKQGDGRLPIKWMAIESLTHQTYNMYSDVWSFGILLWEIVTLGGNPYPGIQTTEILAFLQSGKRMARPENCSPALYDLMRSCWNTKPKDRPNFTYLKLELDKLLSEETAAYNEYLVVTDASSGL